MLTADLVRASVSRGLVHPRYVDRDSDEHRALAGRLIEIFDGCLGERRGRLAQELESFLGTGTEFLLHRGLAKLLYDRCTFESAASAEPEEVRRALFTASAEARRASAIGAARGRAACAADGEGESRAGFDRETVVAAVAAELELAPEDLERALYADLKEEQVLTGWKPIAPQALIDRYNVALAQAVLLRAGEVEIRLGPQPAGRYRALFRKIKFFQLLHRVEGSPQEGYRIVLDGPMSLFKASQKYGLQLAVFLPTLLFFDRWTLEAAVRWGKRRVKRRFRLSPEDGLRPHGRLTGQWQPEEVTALPGRLAELSEEWKVTVGGELVDLGGQGVLVPDLVCEHLPSGVRVWVEILGFWRRGAVDSRLELLARSGPPNLLVALSKSLAAGRDDLDRLPGGVYLFRKVPLARQLLAELDRFLPAAE